MTARNLPDKSTETQAKEQELTRRWPSVWESNSEDFSVPRRVREKIKDVAPQLYEQDRLAEICGEDFGTLSKARHVARQLGVIDSVGDARLVA